ncbi:MAG: 2-phospho-L-lactate guanylyltransferase [Pseudomonadota bacterium]
MTDRRADTMIVVPMKDPSLSKSRLRERLDAGQRERLARLMLHKTLDLLSQLDGVEMAVVTGSDEAATIARTHGVRVIFEPAGCGSLSAALEHAASIAQAEGYKRLCVLPADLAAPKLDDLHALLACQVSVAVCPAADYGTNALLLKPPRAVRFRYGPQSARLHMEEAEKVGLHAVWMPLDSLSLDVDTSACLDEAADIAPEIRALVAAE